MEEKKTCFVISPIGELDSDIRKRSNQVFKHVIKPAVNECGFEPIRADHLPDPGIITSQIIQHVVDDPLVIADLTGRNANVYYELSLRHAIRKPYIQIADRGESLPFDIAGTRTISFDHRDLDSVEDAKTTIVNQIRSFDARQSEVESPISVALQLKLFKQSEDPQERYLAELISTIGDLKTTILNTYRDNTDRFAYTVDMFSYSISETVTNLREAVVEMRHGILAHLQETQAHPDNKNAIEALNRLFGNLDARQQHLEAEVGRAIAMLAAARKRTDTT